MNELIQRERQCPEPLIAALEQAGAENVALGRDFRCPFHNDRKPSAGIYQAPGGVWRFKCHSPQCGFGGDVFDVRARVQGRPVGEVLPRAECQGGAPKPPPRLFASVEEAERTLDGVEGRYTYMHPDTGRPELVVFRLRMPEGKSFRQLSPRSDGFAFVAPPKPWPIYNRTRIRSAADVIVAEGEKAVHALQEIGFVATTSPAGAGKAEHADWRPLAGKRIWLWPDNDPPGRAHMKQVAGKLGQLDPLPEVHMVDVESLGLPPKGDAVDYIGDLEHLDPAGKIRAIEAILEAAKPTGAAADVAEIIESTIAGRRRAIEWPWPKLSALTKALLPGTVTILCGSPGGTKTLLILQALAFWLARGVPFALFALEEDRTHNLLRALAQAAGNSSLTDDEWVSANPGEARRAQAEHAAMLNALGRRIWDAPDHPISLPNLAKWAEDRAGEGARVVVIDPVTAAEATDKPWVADGAFMQAIKATARRYTCSVVLVTHPRKGVRGIASLDDLAGGAAYQRFSQTVLWLEFLAVPKEVQVIESIGVVTVEINRMLRIEKARNGRGGGLALAFNFDANTLRLSEIGAIAKEKKRVPSRAAEGR